MYTVARLNWNIDSMGTLTNHFDVFTTAINYYNHNASVIAYDILFYILLVINIYLYISEEFNLYRRRKVWMDNYLGKLDKVELKHREQKEPEIIRIYKMVFRPTSIFFAAHVAVTLYSELYTWWY
jgi:hypothetical protein